MGLSRCRAGVLLLQIVYTVIPPAGSGELPCFIPLFEVLGTPKIPYTLRLKISIKGKSIESSKSTEKGYHARHTCSPVGGRGEARGERLALLSRHRSE